MKALIIGGTKGFGSDIVAEFEKHGYQVVTVGRSNGDYSVDIGDADEWSRTIQSIQNDHGAFDALICIAGYARALPVEQQSAAVYAEHMQKNVGYVDVALSTIHLNDDAVVMTTGSQWSWKEGAASIEPYIKAKHELASHTKEFAAAHVTLSVAHLCVPPMDTPQRSEVWSEYGDRPETVTDTDVADPVNIARRFTELALEKKRHGEVIQIETGGTAHEIRSEIIHREIQRRQK